MKNLKRISVVCLIVITTIACYAQSKTVKGNGNIKTEERNFALFNGIEVSSGIDVELKQGENQSVFVQTDENLLEYIITEIKGDVLRVYADANIISDSSKHLILMITMKEIKSLHASSNADIIGLSPIKADMLDIKMSSASNIDIDVAANEINIEISSKGNVILRGNADILKAVVSGKGELNAFQLKTREANVTASSGSDAEIYVTEKFGGTASSGGGIYFFGNTESLYMSSGGKIHNNKYSQ